MPQALSRELARFVEITPASGTREKAVHALIVGTVTIGALSAVVGIPLGLTGMTGIFLAISAYDRSLRSRARVLWRLSLAYLLVVAIGAWSSLLPGWAGVIVLAVLATVVAFGYHALLSDPPGPMLLIIGAAVASYIPTLGVPIPLFIGLTAASLVIGCGTSLILQSRHRRAAVRRQLDALRTAVQELKALPTDTDEQTWATHCDAAFAAVFAAQASLASSSPRRRIGVGAASEPGAEHLRIEDELHAEHAELLALVARRDLPWASISSSAMSDHYIGAPREKYLLGWALSRASPVALAARRTGLAVLIAGEFATILGLAHPYWAVMTAALVLSSTADRISTSRRAAHRVVGTLAGVLIFLAIFALHPPEVVVAGIVVCCVALTQVFAPRHYALTTTVMTPMPLLMAAMHLTGSANVAALAQSRIVETVIGSIATMLVLWAQGPGTVIVLVRRQFRRALTAADTVLRQMAADPSPAASIEARRNLHFEQLAAARALALALPDQPEALGGWPAVEAELSRLTYTVLTAARAVNPERVLAWNRMADSLEGYLASLPAVSSKPVDAAAAAHALARVRARARPRDQRENRRR
ncbi:MAG: FUSC family protein [Actinomycetales bacterium]